MSDRLIIETPEQIPLEFSLAGIGSRFLALALDTLLQVLALFSLSFIALLALGSGFPSSRGRLWGAAGIVLVAFLIQFGYFAFFEAVWNGQTPGKRYVHLRVINESGRPINTYQSLARNLLRIVDSIPGIYAVGILCALLNGKNKRLGDYVAGTVVVHEGPLDKHADATWGLAEKKQPPAPVPAPTGPPGSVLNLGSGPQAVASQTEPGPSRSSGYEVSRLSDQEFQLLEAFLLRRRQLAADVRLRMARKIMDRLAVKLEISEEDKRTSESLLEKLAAEYRNRVRFR
jgi:uncharacterized RDD family membrane protein YckC